MQIVKKLIQRNYTSGRFNYKIKRIILHTYGGGGKSLYNWFNSENAKASAHYAVFKDGGVEQYVEDSNMAWHAGTTQQPNNNFESVGIEFQDDANWWDSVRTNELYESGAQLVAQLCKKHKVACKLLPKSDSWGNGIAPHNYYANKSCPAGLDMNRIIKRANEILNGVTTPTPEPIENHENETPIMIAVQSGDGYSLIAKRAGWSNWDNATEVITQLKKLNPNHPSFARGNSLWASDPAFIVGYKPKETTPPVTPEPTIPPVDYKDLYEKAKNELENLEENNKIQDEAIVKLTTDRDTWKTLSETQGKVINIANERITTLTKELEAIKAESDKNVFNLIVTRLTKWILQFFKKQS